MAEQAELEATGKRDTVVSHSGVPLTRATTFRFTLDVNREQHQRLLPTRGRPVWRSTTTSHG